MDVALALDAMVLIRIIVGLVRRDRGDVWALYLALPFLVIVVLWIVMPLVGGH
jgi:hypothetical protein